MQVYNISNLQDYPWTISRIYKIIHEQRKKKL